MDIDLTQAFCSHRGKFLQDHLDGVARKVNKRTAGLPTTLNFKTAEVAALFHDLGKINPNFQRKLNGIKKGYTGHSYLSALAWFGFLQTNVGQVEAWLAKPERVFSVAAMIARHHGDLPNLAEGVFNQQPFEDLQKFLSEQPELPLSDFLQLLIPHNSFALPASPLPLKKIGSAKLKPQENQLAFFLETQFGFACLLESDKRDAGNNEVYKRENLKPYFQQHFAPQLTAKIEKIGQAAQEKPSNTELNRVRTQMRGEAVLNLQAQLQQTQRVFTLAAPTGAGKTLMLLSLAQEILARNPDLNVIYALPFLSITEQVEKICQDIFGNFHEVEKEKYKNDVPVLRFDSRAENQTIERIQSALETEPSEELLAQLLQENFSAETFDHPFIVTTFVQVFETLVSNRNATLLRLPNFARSIFLLDEIQALPPRLYIFFTALLDEFCRQFDSYAIISTATMPYLEITPKTHVTQQPAEQKPELLFVNYQQPPPELSNPEHFTAPVFNRYRITKEDHLSSIELLAEQICERDESCLVILNTIDDTKQLYAELQARYETDECVLLNTHFTLNDRRTKLAYCQQRLDDKEKIILVSTQLIEAGVDIDFPALYRDLCPLPNLIQSAGRCNRNGKLPRGEVHFIALRRGDGKTLSAQMIYRGKDKILLDFGRDTFPAVVTEGEMKSIQQEYFEFIGKNLTIGEHEQTNAKLHMVQHINKAEFETLGKFRLIDEREFGEEFRYFIPRDEDDSRFEELRNLAETKLGKSFEEAKQRQIKIESKLREMAGDIVQFRLSIHNISFQPPPEGNAALGIYKLAQTNEYYSYQTGIRLETGGCII